MFAAVWPSSWLGATAGVRKPMRFQPLPAPWATFNFRRTDAKARGRFRTHMRANLPSGLQDWICEFQPAQYLPCPCRDTARSQLVACRDSSDERRDAPFARAPANHRTIGLHARPAYSSCRRPRGSPHSSAGYAQPLLRPQQPVGPFRSHQYHIARLLQQVRDEDPGLCRQKLSGSRQPPAAGQQGPLRQPHGRMPVG